MSKFNIIVQPLIGEKSGAQFLAALSSADGQPHFAPTRSFDSLKAASNALRLLRVRNQEIVALQNAMAAQQSYVISSLELSDDDLSAFQSATQ